MSRTFEQIQALVARQEIRISEHGYDELAADNILVDDIISGVASGSVVEDYPITTRGRVRWFTMGCTTETDTCCLGSTKRRLDCGGFGDRIPTRSGELERRLLEEKSMKKRSRTKLIHEGQYAAEVEVELIEAEDGWSPYLSLEDGRKLDDVRQALRRGDLKRASQLARVYQLMPVSA